MKARFVTTWMFVALVSLASAAFAQDRRDVRAADDISRAVNRYSRFTIFDDINARIENGIVTLSGKVTMPYKKDDIGRIVAKVDGVREVQNNIDVLPVSSYDENLRYRIARAIYVTASEQRVVIVRIFVKKTQKTPLRELELGRQRA